MTAQLAIDFREDARRDIERLVPIAQELARIAGPHGITIANVRHAAEARGLLTGAERGRRLSFLGAVMKAAGLVATEDYRRSDIPRSNGNLHRIWIAQDGAA